MSLLYFVEINNEIRLSPRSSTKINTVRIYRGWGVSGLLEAEDFFKKINNMEAFLLFFSHFLAGLLNPQNYELAPQPPP